jgi:quinol-cytochrome oxidoreductase complex cytochrome b subunit
MAGSMQISCTCASTAVGIAVQAFTVQPLTAAHISPKWQFFPSFDIMYVSEITEGLLTVTAAGTAIANYTC